MDQQQAWLAERFEEQRPHLQAVAYRMLGSANEADDAVQESWLRLSRSDASGVENLRAWLTTVVARISLDMLRSRSGRREEPLEDAPDTPAETTDPEREALIADSVGVALLVVLDTLTPPERIAFVLHDLFAVPFDEVAPIVGRTPAAARQLASRARRRVQGADPANERDLVRRREVVHAFLAASRNGDFAALLDLLDPDAVVRADAAVVAMGVEAEARGAIAVATTFSGRARAAKLAFIDGTPGAAFAPGGRPRVVFEFTIADGKIIAIDLVADSDQLAEMELVVTPE